MRRVIIADIKSLNTNGKSLGHYYEVADMYTKIFRTEREVYVSGGPIYSGRFENLMELPFDTSNSKNILQNKYCMIKNLRKLFKEGSKDIIIFQCSGVATAYLGIWMFAKKNTPIFMIQYNTSGVDSIVKRIMYAFIKNKISGIICPMENIGRSYNRPYCIVPDYIYTGKKIYEEQYRSPQYDFCTVGLIVESKGILEVVEKLAHTKYRLLVAGRVENDELRRKIEEACAGADNVTLQFEYLSEEDYQKAIQMSKYCVLNYSGDYSAHSSGVVYDILFNQRPILARSCKVLNFIGENNLGYVYENMSEIDYELLLDENEYSKKLVAINDYLKKNSYYGKKLKKFISKYEGDSEK